MPFAPSIRTILPLALVTGMSMAAMDLYLPAVPALQRGMGIDVPLAQATVSVYLAGLAAAQLLWGALLKRLGPRRCLQFGLSLLVLTSVGCACAPSIETLLGAGALGTQLVSPFVGRAGSTVPLCASVGMQLLASAALVWRYPAKR